MGPATHSRRNAVLIALALAVLLSGLYLAVAAPYLSSRQEEMTLNDVPIDVTYAESASADDLMMPFYPGASVGDSFAYTITGKDGKPVSQYASAMLATPDSWEKVTAYYTAELPGNPQPEAIEDKAGTRHVLAVANDGETRMVTVRATETGSRIDLLRATETTPPVKPLEPRRRESLI